MGVENILIISITNGNNRILPKFKEIECLPSDRRGWSHELRKVHTCIPHSNQLTKNTK
jgi:hypothetical protein